MRKVRILLLFVFISLKLVIAQSPNLMSYQAVIWDANGNLVAEKTVNIKISILKGSVNGVIVYSETHRVQTNINGLVSLMIGGGSNPVGKILDIDWNTGTYFLKTETDPTGGGNYSIIGVTQFVSVPYSMFSEKSANVYTTSPGLPGQVLTLTENGKLSWSGVAYPKVITKTILTPLTSSILSLGGEVISDGGAPVTSRGVVWSNSPQPDISLSSKTSDGNGIGSFIATLTNLKPKITYYVRAYATNISGTGYGNELTFTTSDSFNVMNIPCQGILMVKDIDGNTYNTVQIGTQCWTKENLRVTKYRDGSIIPLDESGGTTGNGTGQTWSSRTTGARTVYGHNAANLATYGYLYNWYSVADSKGLCPNGWHVPSEAEWTTLTTYLGGEIVAGGKMKSVGTAYWNSPNTGVTNESGFSAFPGGARGSDGGFFNIRSNGFFWSATERDVSNAWYRYLLDGNGVVNKLYGSLRLGLSVRCLKDTNSIVSIPSLTTTAITAITATSSTSGGNITADGGAPITARGVVWSTSTNPTITLTTKTSNGTGISSFTSSLTNLTPKTTYYVRAYATNSAGTSYGNEISFTTSEAIMNIPCPGTPTVKDIDGNTYNTVQIGTQCWMRDNLKVTKHRDGSIIPLDGSGGTSGNGTGQTWSSRATGARTVYGHSATNLSTYGYLYNWYAVSDTKGLCPSGWNVPSESDWNTLSNFLGDEIFAGGKMKESGTTNWVSPNINANNESGFSAIPSGFRKFEGEFSNLGSFSIWWSSTIFDEGDEVWALSVKNDNSTLSWSDLETFELGASIRCIKDTLFNVTSNSTNEYGKPCLNVSNVIDIDGNNYNTVLVGNQCWLKENLKVTKYRDGSLIPLDNTGGPTGNGTNQLWSTRNYGSRTIYGHNATNLKNYGYLYNWYAVTDIKGICPTGWHIPTDSEWTNLANFLGGEGLAGGKLKSTTNWKTPNRDATNEVGFSGLNGGIRGYDGTFALLRYGGFFWSNTTYDTGNAWTRALDYDSGNLGRDYENKLNGLYIRCLKD